MATAVLFIGFGAPHDMTNPDQAFRWLASEGLEYLRKQEGKLTERTEIIALTPHGGDLSGAIIVFGERAKLDELRRTDEFEAFSMQASRRLSHFGVVPGVNWDGMQAVMKRIQSK